MFFLVFLGVARGLLGNIKCHNIVPPTHECDMTGGGAQSQERTILRNVNVPKLGYWDLSPKYQTLYLLDRPGVEYS